MANDTFIQQILNDLIYFFLLRKRQSSWRRIGCAPRVHQYRFSKI